MPTTKPLRVQRDGKEVWNAPDTFVAGTASMEGAGRSRRSRMAATIVLKAVEQRIDGYRRAMFEEQLLPHVIGGTGMRQESGHTAITQLIESGQLPEAVVCANDEVAVGVLARLWTSGYKIPGDVSVAGIGGTRSGAVFGLTTVTLPLMELGGLAARYIADPSSSPNIPEAPHFTVRAGVIARRYLTCPLLRARVAPGAYVSQCPLAVRGPA